MYLNNCEVKEIEDGKVEISGPGIMTGKKQKVVVQKEAFEKWKSGDLFAQEAFPELSADEREFLISGIEIGEFENFLDQ